MKIKEVSSLSKKTISVIDQFLTILFEKNRSISKQTLDEFVSSENSHLFFAFDTDENCMGMITVGIYVSTSGKKSWIEDVVVGKEYRGRGIGRKLTEHAIDFSKKKGVELLMLTSKPRRIAANKIYSGLQFERKETNVYKMEF